MSNPTSSFGWQMPTASDLVTDLPADFETFGQAVDTSLADLKGGTTGQILSKASNTDMDFTWVAPTTGDITGVSVTSPITGGGTSGDVTIGISSTAVVPSQTGNSGKYLTTDGTNSSWGTISAGGMTTLASGSLSGGSVVLSSISGSYNSLRLVVRNFRPATSNSSLTIRFNGDTSSNYYSTTSTDLNAIDFNVSSIVFGKNTGSVTSYALHVLDLPDYAFAGTWKFANMCSIVGRNGDPTLFSSALETGMWDTSGSYAAINSITILPSAGNFTSGTYVLYGVK